MRLDPLALSCLLLTLTACPPSVPDPDDTGDSPADSGDTGDPDIDPGSSAWTSSAHSGCGPLASVIWLQDPSGESEAMVAFASTVADFCAIWLAAEATIAAEYPAFAEAYSQALDAGDYPAACQARLAWEQTYQPHNDAMVPAGSCTAELITASADPGAYDTSDYTSMAAVWQAQADLGSALVAAFEGCAGVTDEESWDARLDAVAAAQTMAMPFWNTSAGMIVIEAEGEDGRHVTGSDLTLGDWTETETGTLSFDLHAAFCGG